VNAKCTFHFISREQSVFFHFELFCLQVQYRYIFQVCGVGYTYTLSFGILRTIKSQQHNQNKCSSAKCVQKAEGP